MTRKMHTFLWEGEATSRGEDPGNFYEKLVLFKPLKMWKEVMRVGEQIWETEQNLKVKKMGLWGDKFYTLTD